MRTLALILSLTLLLAAAAWADDLPLRISVPAADKYERSALAEMGLDIVEVHDAFVVIYGWPEEFNTLAALGYAVQAEPVPGALHDVAVDPAYHYYAETVALLTEIAGAHPDVMSMFSLGQSIEGRELYTVKISDNPDQDESAEEPGLSFVAQHHAREHISVEVPLGFLMYVDDTYDYLYSTTNMVQTHEIWITPTINPDGAEYDTTGGSYQYWRKNRRDNSGSCEGVDLNRNYSYQWGGSGSSSNTCAETYRGTAGFSEPETAAYRDFVAATPGIDIIVSYHNYGMLTMWPWSYSYSSIPEPDRTIHQTLGTTYAGFTGYTPQQSSALYTAAGDTCDWAYGEQSRICFCVELDPGSFGDFYFSGSLIPAIVAKNLDGMLYLVWESADPGKDLGAPQDRQGVVDSWARYRYIE